jgi:peroxiredoxin Q/BCP
MIEGQGFRDRTPEFSKLGAVILGCSYDPPETNKEFAEREGFPYALLSDVDHTVADLYSVSFPPGHEYEKWLKRFSFLIDPTGHVHKIYKVADVAGHAEQLLYDLTEAAGETPAS